MKFLRWLKSLFIWGAEQPTKLNIPASPRKRLLDSKELIQAVPAPKSNPNLDVTLFAEDLKVQAKKPEVKSDKPRPRPRRVK